MRDVLGSPYLVPEMVRGDLPLAAVGAMRLPSRGGSAWTRPFDSASRLAAAAVDAAANTKRSAAAASATSCGCGGTRARETASGDGEEGGEMFQQVEFAILEVLRSQAEWAAGEKGESEAAGRPSGGAIRTLAK